MKNRDIGRGIKQITCEEMDHKGMEGKPVPAWKIPVNDSLDDWLICVSIKFIRKQKLKLNP